MVSGVVRFHGFELDPLVVELRQAGRRVDAARQTLKLLEYLIAHRHRAISRDELFARIWPGVFVSDSALSNAIYELRRVLGDDGGRQEIIRTVRGHGFRFVAALEEADAERSPRPHAGPADAAYATPAFIGRRDVLAQLESAFAQARAGRGRLVLVEGEAGMGKTSTTTQELVSRLVDVQVYVGRCYEGSGAPPFWPWMQVLREQLAHCDAADLRRAVGHGAARLAEIVPSLADEVGDVPVVPTLDPAEARFQLFDAVGRWLRSSAQHQPVVIVLDDLHWADHASLLLLEFLAVELMTARAVIVGTFRSEEVVEGAPLAATLAQLARHAHCERLVLHGLDRGEVEILLTTTLQRHPSPDLLAAVMEASEGNPFFVKEIARLVETVPHDEASARARLVLPGAVKEVITRRISRLAPATQQLLEVAAVIGREFRLDVLDRLWTAPAPLLDAVDEAIRARLLAERPETIGGFRFAHGLIQETLYDAVGSRRRADLHRRVAESLETLCGAETDARLAELAYHWCAALPGGSEPSKAITYSMRAGDRAAAMLAYEEAVRHYRRAADAAEWHVQIDRECRADVFLALGTAQTRSGDSAAARDSFDRAASLAADLDDHERLGRAALGYADAGFEFARSNTLGVARPVEQRAIALLEAALRGISEADRSPLRVRLLGRLARELHQPESRARRLALSESALHLAHRLGDPVCLAETVTVRREVLCEPENLHERFALSNEIVRLADQTGNRELTLAGRTWRLVDLLELGEVNQVRVEIEACERSATELRQPRFLYSVALLRVALTLLDGRHDDAEEAANQALAIGRRVNAALAEFLHMVQLVSIRRQQGRLQEILATAQALGAAQPTVSVRVGLAYIYAELGHREIAAREFEDVAAADFADFPRDRLWLGWMTVLAEVCATVGDRDRAATLYNLLAPYAHHDVVGGEGALAYGSASFQLGRLAMLLERWSEAEAYFDLCLTENSRIVAPAYRGQIYRAFVELYVARAWPGDRARADQFIMQGLEVAQRFDMPALRDRLLALGTAAGVDSCHG